MSNMKSLFAIEKKPVRGLMAFEWVVMAYGLFTLLMVLVMFTRLDHPTGMIWDRLRLLTVIPALWAVYRLLPCRLTLLARVAGQQASLSWWYPDTYELNKALPNLDHVFASFEQSVFGCQPALLFSRYVSSPVFSELMDLGYASYFPMIVAVTLFYFFYRPQEFTRMAFVTLAAFMIYYVIFVFLPVTGPQYYYLAVGEDRIAQGIFPDIGDYFRHSQERMVSPGWSHGFFYGLVEDAHNAGERPTAAFPSSHVGITTILLLQAWHTRNRRFFWTLVPFFVLMFFATVYIKAHYAVDAVAGLASGVVMYVVLYGCSRRIKAKGLF